MSEVGWFFGICVVGIIISSVVLFGELYLFNALPSGQGKQLVASNLIGPLELLIVLFVIGAVISGYVWLRMSAQSPDYQP